MYKSFKFLNFLYYIQCLLRYRWMMRIVLLINPEKSSHLMRFTSTGLPSVIVFCFIVLQTLFFVLFCSLLWVFCCLFTNWKVMKVMSTLHQTNRWAPLFSTSSAHFGSLYHILVIVTIFKTFSLLLYLLWWSVISDYDVLKAQRTVSIF